ncbi:periplasmic heavy metal sensor [Desulfovibrio subterraneus]|nr:hypothetical protein [Desulfovibrio subterraneus]WBF68416.1 periplasmic heavy metal sensor [Desulfovibrio subterraneus]
MYVWTITYAPGFPPPPEEMRERIFMHLKREIQLTPEQERVIRPEFEEAWEQGEVLRREMEPKLRALFDETDERIRGYLSPEQKVLLEEFHKKMSERRGKFGPPPTPPPPPPLQ